IRGRIHRVRVEAVLKTAIATHLALAIRSAKVYLAGKSRILSDVKEGPGELEGVFVAIASLTRSAIIATRWVDHTSRAMTGNWIRRGTCVDRACDALGGRIRTVCRRILVRTPSLAHSSEL